MALDTMKGLLVAGFVSLAFLGFIECVQGQPSSAVGMNERPVTLVVPFAAGGGSDILARIVADKLRSVIKQTVIVDNRPGANGLIASQFVEKSKPDGYTLMLGSNSTHVIAPLLQPDKEAGETIRKKFALISMISGTPLVLAVSEQSAIKDLKQFLSQSDKELTFGTFGVHSSPHLMGTLLAAQSGARLLHVPYKGSAPAVTDLLSGQISSVFLTIAAISTYVESKHIRALAVTGTKRVATLPDVPTFQERGIEGLENPGWFAVFAPANVPAPVAAYLREGVREIMSQPDMQTKLQELGLQDARPLADREAAVWSESIVSTKAILRKTGLDLN